MTAITRRQARDYRERWKIVRARESCERDTTSTNERARQLSVPMTSQFLFERDSNRERLGDEVRLRLPG